jgi:hypothetical protein
LSDYARSLHRKTQMPLPTFVRRMWCMNRSFELSAEVTYRDVKIRFLFCCPNPPYRRIRPTIMADGKATNETSMIAHDRPIFSLALPDCLHPLGH